MLITHSQNTQARLFSTQKWHFCKKVWPCKIPEAKELCSHHLIFTESYLGWWWTVERANTSESVLTEIQSLPQKSYMYLGRQLSSLTLIRMDVEGFIRTKSGSSIRTCKTLIYCLGNNSLLFNELPHVYMSLAFYQNKIHVESLPCWRKRKENVEKYTSGVISYEIVNTVNLVHSQYTLSSVAMNHHNLVKEKPSTELVSS